GRRVQGQLQGGGRVGRVVVEDEPVGRRDDVEAVLAADPGVAGDGAGDAVRAAPHPDGRAGLRDLGQADVVEIREHQGVVGRVVLDVVEVAGAAAAVGGLGVD